MLNIFRRAALIFAVGLPLVFLGVFFAYPVVAILERGLAGGVGPVLDVFRNESRRNVLWFTVWQAVLSTALTVVLAVPAAGVLARYRVPGRRLIRAVLTVPFVLPTVVVATAFSSTFDVFGLNDGAVRLRHTVWAILLAHVFFNFAVVVRTVGTVWSSLDRRPEEAARTLGASPWAVFRFVTLPQLAPAISAAAAIVFLFSFTSFGVILILGGPRRATLETEIYRFATQRTDFETAAALATIQLVAVVALLLATELLRRRIDVGHGQRGADQARRPNGTKQWTYTGATLGFATALTGVPLVALLERSLRTGTGYSLDNYRGLAEGERISALLTPPTEAIGNSVAFAAVATAIAVLIGVPAALVVVHGRAGLSRLFDIAFAVPVGTSAVTVGFGMLIALDEPPLDLRTSWWLVPIAQGLIGIPFVIRSVTPVLRSIDPALREAAAVLGAPPYRVRREVDLPIALRGIAVGASFAFAISLGEFGATSFLVRPGRPTVPVAIFRLLGQPGSVTFGQAMALSVVLVMITGLAVLVIERLSPESGVF